MSLTVYDTATRSRTPFEPLDKGSVTMYACGPTIYDHAHVGNFRTFLFSDIVHRYLEWSGYRVRFVMNLTDVDDKTIASAAEAGTSVIELTRRFADAFFADAQSLGIRPADAYPRATEYVPRMVDFIRGLMDAGHAYAAEDGAVYFSIASFERYGSLRGLDLSELKVGARVAQDEYDKEDARDFALWKAATPEDEAVGAAWDAPWGRGRPGWHLECSVMSLTELGTTIDLHLGGEDLVFPHHENEIAQSEAATGELFVRHWLHVKHLLLEGRKMSKSLGNYVTVRELLQERHPPAAIRHLLISSHYRSELNFTRQGLVGSKSAVQRLVDFETRLRTTATTPDPAASNSALPALAHDALDAFRAAMDDDLNTAEALAAVFTFVSRANAELDRVEIVNTPDRDAALHALVSIDEVLGLLEVAHTTRSLEDDIAAWVEQKILERAEARAARDFAAADAIRDELAARDIVLEDRPEGTRWKVVR